MRLIVKKTILLFYFVAFNSFLSNPIKASIFMRDAITTAQLAIGMGSLALSYQTYDLAKTFAKTDNVSKYLIVGATGTVSAVSGLAGIALLANPLYELSTTINKKQLILAGTAAASIWYLFPKLQQSLKKLIPQPVIKNNTQLSTIDNTIPKIDITNLYNTIRDNPNSRMFELCSVSINASTKTVTGCPNFLSRDSVSIVENKLMFNLRSLGNLEHVVDLPFDYKQVSLLTLSSSFFIDPKGTGHTAIKLNNNDIILINNATKKMVQFNVPYKVTGLEFISPSNSTNADTRLLIRQEGVAILIDLPLNIPQLT